MSNLDELRSQLADARNARKVAQNRLQEQELVIKSLDTLIEILNVRIAIIIPLTPPEMIDGSRANILMKDELYGVPLSELEDAKPVLIKDRETLGDIIVGSTSEDEPPFKGKICEVPKLEDLPDFANRNNAEGLKELMSNFRENITDDKGGVYHFLHGLSEDDKV